MVRGIPNVRSAVRYPSDRPLTITKTGRMRCRHGCDPEAIAEALNHEPETTEARTETTWAPIPLAEILDGTYSEPEPEMLPRTDGRCLLYAGRTHALNAEPEGLKTWLALKACAKPLRIGEAVLFIDFEDSAPAIARRLLDLGVGCEAITGSFVYIRPDEPLAEAALQDLDDALRREPALAVIDGVTEAFGRQGLNPLDNSDVAAWLDLLPRRLVRAGAAVLLLDHVVKDREQRGRYAIGAQHKLAGIDVAYSLRVLEPFAPGHDGLVAIRVEKDRPGRVRAFAPDGRVAQLRAHSEPDGAVTITLEPPEDSAGTFRPTVLMERISRAVEDDPGLSKRAIREAVRGKTAALDLALELLVSERHVEAHRDGQAKRHHSLRPYREDEDDSDRDPVTQPRPNRDPDKVGSDRDPVTPPLKGVTVTAHNNGRPSQGDCDPDIERAEAILARHQDMP